MKTIRTLLTAVAILFGTMTMNAQMMSYEAMRNNARFLTDRMAYELGIRSMSMIDDLYRINFDYIYGVNEYLDEVALGYFYDDYMDVLARRDYALRRLLGDIIWDRLIRYDYFYRPIGFANRGWRFLIYDYDRYGAHHFFYREPRHFGRRYEGGHFFHGMRPAGGHVMHRPQPSHRPNYDAGRPQNNHNRPQGGMNNRPQNGHNRPQGGINNSRPQNDNNRPQGGMNNSRPQNDNNRPQGGLNNSRPQNDNNRPQGGMNNSRPQNSYDRPQGGMNNSRPQGGSSARGSRMTTRSENNTRSSSRSGMSRGESRGSMGRSESRGSMSRGESRGNSGGAHRR